MKRFANRIVQIRIRIWYKVQVKLKITVDARFWFIGIGTLVYQNNYMYNPDIGTVRIFRIYIYDSLSRGLFMNSRFVCHQNLHRKSITILNLLTQFIKLTKLPSIPTSIAEYESCHRLVSTSGLKL